MGKIDGVEQCYLGLGSNLSNAQGSPKEHIAKAIDQLEAYKDISDVRVSSLYESAPLGPQDQPDFINAVIALKTSLAPVNLLMLCQQLEHQAMRIRKRHWGERSLDVDILLYGDETIDLPSLTIPHKGLFERNFVLIPLLELVPDLFIQGQRISDCDIAQDWTGLTKIVN